MSAGFFCGITLELLTDKCYGQPLSSPVITQRAASRAASASLQTQFYKTLNYFFLYSPRKKSTLEQGFSAFPFLLKMFSFENTFSYI